MISSQNFSQTELEYSTKASKKGINNQIPVEYLDNAKELINALQKIRDALGKPIQITSGYRCPELNKLVRVYFNLSDTEFIRLDIEKDCNKLFNGEKVLKGEYVLWPFRALTTVENL